MAQTLAERAVASQPWLDAVADRLQPVVQNAVAKGGTRVRNLLDGAWLGTPLHPAVSDVPVGAWTAAVALDGLEAGEGSPLVRRSADGALAIGVAGALAASTTGFSDWRYLRGEERRLALAHGLLNGTGVLLMAGSLALRSRGNRRAGRMLSTAGYLLASAAAHVGGELTYGHGVRVNRTAWQRGPTEFTAVLEEAELDGSALRRVDADGVPILLARAGGGEICAIAETCSHLGGPLSEGKQEGDTVVCPWHASRFDLRTGEVVDGPALFAQPRFDVRVSEGRVEVRATG